MDKLHSSSDEESEMSNATVIEQSSNFSNIYEVPPSEKSVKDVVSEAWSNYDEKEQMSESITKAIEGLEQNVMNSDVEKEFINEGSIGSNSSEDHRFVETEKKSFKAIKETVDETPSQFFPQTSIHAIHNLASEKDLVQTPRSKEDEEAIRYLRGIVPHHSSSDSVDKPRYSEIEKQIQSKKFEVEKKISAPVISKEPQRHVDSRYAPELRPKDVMENVSSSYGGTGGGGSGNDIHEHYLSHTSFKDIFSEPEKDYKSIAIVWDFSRQVFDYTRIYLYIILSTVFGIILAAIAGILVALFTFLNIWIIRPLLQLIRISLSQVAFIWPMLLLYVVRPVFYSIGAIFSTIQLKTSNSVPAVEVWENHVHLV
ncbi:unnamed protein product [Caenorhabditis bovis]|uniref:Caveolin n=1 Tax=Caenorhabditis bovis TaxID=2654633 RepID=A0A8S1E8A2_9PELO|nr:unnamed protein product [Caenorhabditis bovis]